MVAEIQLKQNNDGDVRFQAQTDNELSSFRDEEDGFYSSCGQAYIRIK